MKSQIKLLFILIILLVVVSLPKLGVAIDELQIQDYDIEATTVPANPEPYQNVTINLKSYGADLNKAQIEWQSGSSIVLSGIGRTSYSFKALGPNTSTIIKISITPYGSLSKITKQIVISPTDIELLWEGVSAYTPPFYKGKSFPSSESLIRVVAIPNNSSIKSNKNLTYTWKNNGKTVPNASGYGKDSYVFTNSEMNSSDSITVTVSSIDGSYNATKTVNIPMTDPKIVFYEKSPTEGIMYNSALTDGTYMEKEEMTVVAVPYFLGVVGNESRFTYNWQINNKAIDTPSKKTELTVRPNSRGGYATIRLVMENMSTYFQSASGQIRLSI